MMDIVLSVSLSLLTIGGVFLTIYLLSTLSYHDEKEL